jgi:hypothetical protein
VFLLGILLRSPIRSQLVGKGTKGLISSYSFLLAVAVDCYPSLLLGLYADVNQLDFRKWEFFQPLTIQKFNFLVKL